jgi:ABC-type hemin transport system ATPase subunit
MSKIDFKSLSPEVVATLSPKDRANYDKWLAKQSDVEKDEGEQEVEEETNDLVEVEALRQVNTSLYGHIYPGEKNRKKISRVLAGQLAKLGEVKIIG